jgi:hypothetical protein
MGDGLSCRILPIEKTRLLGTDAAPGLYTGRKDNWYGFC